MKRSWMMIALAFGPVLFGQSYTFTSLTFPGAVRTTSGTGLNDLGTIIGTYTFNNPAPEHGFVLENVTYTPFDVPGSTLTHPAGINGRGYMVGWYVGGVPLLQHGFIRQGDVLSNIDFPGAPISNNPFSATSPMGINDRDEIVGGYYGKDSNLHGFLRERDQYTTIDVPFPEALCTTAMGINNRGDIIGIYCAPASPGPRGFLKKGSHFHRLNFPGAIDTIPRGINNRGEIVGSFQTSDFVTHGFIFSKGKFTQFEVLFPDATTRNTTPSGINDLGEITGSCAFANPLLQFTGFLAKPVEPADQ